MTEEFLLRWRRTDRLTHWLLSLGLTVLILTGLPLFDSTAFGFFVPLAKVPNVPDLPGRSGIHFAGAMLVLAAALIHVGSRAARPGTRIGLSGQDFRDLTTVAVRALGGRRAPPQLRFHHPGEKLVYWVVAVLGLLVTGSSGLILWFRQGMGFTHTWAVTFHYLGFILMAIPLLGHLLTALHPDNRSVLKAMFVSGRVSKRWALQHAPGWVRELEAGSAVARR